MLALLQRVKKANVEVEGRVVSQISNGLLVLLGVLEGDTKKDAEYLANKLVNLRVFPNGEQDFDQSVKELQGEILLVSQFTLAGDTKKGRRPSFSAAMHPESAKPLYEYLSELLSKDVSVQTGIFGAHMEVGLVNDGPVTLLVDSRKGAAL